MINLDVRRLLFCSYHCYVDPSSGAAQSVRDLLPMLTERGWKCQVFCGPQVDFEDGRQLRNVLHDPNFDLGRPLQARAYPDVPVPFALFDYAQGDIPIVIFDSPQALPPQEPPAAVGNVFLALFDKILDQYRPDLLLSYGGQGVAQEMMARARRHGIPVIFWLHNTDYQVAQFFAGLTGTIVPSQFAREHYRRKLGLECTVLPPPLDWTRRVCSAARHGATKEMRPGELSRQFVTFVNPQPAKGVFVFAAIVLEMHRRRPDIPFLVVAARAHPGWLAQAGLDLKKLGTVQVKQASADPRSFYASSRLLLMPSLWAETFGRVAAEALANGIPVLASQRGALPETLADAAFLFEIAPQHTTASRVVPSAAEVTPWVDMIIRLWDDQQFYDSAARRCRAAAEQWRPERLGAAYDEFLRRSIATLGEVSPDAAAPLISVIMPVYNGAAFLERAIVSLLAQTFAIWELLVVDDGSTDGSFALLERCAAQDRRIRLFRLAKNSGAAAARNHALGQMRGQVVAYLDCDDQYYPDYLESVATRFHEGDVLVHGYDMLEERPQAANFGATCSYDPGPFREELFRKERNIAIPLCVAHRQELLARSGLFDEDAPVDHDWRLLQRFVDIGATVIFVRRRCGLYRVRPGSLSDSWREGKGRAA